MVIIDSHLPTRSSVYTIENPQYALLAPEMSPINKKICPIVSTNKLATPSKAIIKLFNFFIINSLFEIDI